VKTPLPLMVNVIKLFLAKLNHYLSQNHMEICRQWRKLRLKKFYNIGHWLKKLAAKNA
jgi:hypothetical protein